MSVLSSHFLFLFSNFWREIWFSFNFFRNLYHYKIQVKFHIDNHLPNFGLIMALFRLSFCWCVGIGFRSIPFAGMHCFYWKFSEGYIIVKCRSSSILVIICKILAKLWPFFDLAFVGVLILVVLNNFSGVHWFYWKFAKGYIIVKYRSSLILVVICQILAELRPFFSLVFVGVLILVSTQNLLQGCIDFIESLQKDISL